MNQTKRIIQLVINYKLHQYQKDFKIIILLFQTVQDLSNFKQFYLLFLHHYLHTQLIKNNIEE